MFTIPKINEKRFRRTFPSPRVKSRLSTSESTDRDWRSIYLTGRGCGISFSQVIELAMKIFMYLTIDHVKSDSNEVERLANEIRRAVILFWYTNDGTANMINNLITLSLELTEDLPKEAQSKILGVDTPFIS